ncbi:MAG: nucleotidyltransferase family protein, partial [Lentisphaeraceae bacterium]|nr:nucleotidyltransferase family protein [Lentisphaeraceae bacterium]
MPVNLFIPAAGLGTRLRPLTSQVPKPLLSIAGVPLIQRILENICSSIEVDRIGINTHYLPEVIQNWSSESSFSDKIELFHEKELLGTGGALKNAETLLGQKTFIVVNGDVLADIDWKALLEHHHSQKNLVTLA